MWAKAAISDPSDDGVVQYNVEDFLQFPALCRARQVADRWEELQMDAKMRGRDVKDEMKSQGFHNMKAFLEDCPTFDMFGSSYKLRELGAEVIVYFNFLFLLGFLLLAVFLLQIPAMVEYSRQDLSENFADTRWEDLYFQDCSKLVFGTANETTYERGSLYFMRRNPGMLGPCSSGASRGWVLSCYLACGATILLLTMFHQIRMVRLMDAFDATTILPNDYSILVKGLPLTATSESAIKEFFERHALRDREAEVVKVVIGWDLRRYAELIRELKALSRERAALTGSDDVDAREQQRSISGRIGEIVKDLSSVLDGNTMLSTGNAIVTFRNRADLRSCIGRWNGFLQRMFYTESLHISCSESVGLGDPLPRYPMGDPPKPLVPLCLERAPNPGDICWTTLGIPARERWRQFSKTKLMFLGVLFAAFLCIWGVKLVKAPTSAIYINLFQSFTSILINMLIRVMAKKLATKEYHETLSMSEFSQMFNVTLCTMVTSSGLLYFVYARPDEWYAQDGLVYAAFVQMVVLAVLSPFINWLDIPYKLHWFSRVRLTEGMVTEWNQQIASSIPANTKEKKHALKLVNDEVDIWLNTFKPSQMDFVGRYAKMLTLFFSCLFFSPLVPVVSLIGMLGIFLQYWVDKYMVTCWCPQVESTSSDVVSRCSVDGVKWLGPLALGVGCCTFLTPSWKDKGVIWQFALLYVAVYVLCNIFPYGALKTVARCFCSDHYEEQEDDTDYYDAQYFWSCGLKYHKDHILYARLPESVNPEMLKPGNAATRVQDFKAGKSEGGNWDGQIAPSCATQRRYKPGAQRGTTAVRQHAQQPTSATVYGCRGPSPQDLACDTEWGRVPMVAPTPVASRASGAVRGVQHSVSWTMMSRWGWRPLPQSDAVEQLHREYEAGTGSARVELVLGEAAICVDFHAMTVQLVGSHITRAIKRLEME